MRDRNGIPSLVLFGLIVLPLLSAPGARAADKTNIVVLTSNGALSVLATLSSTPKAKSLLQGINFIKMHNPTNAAPAFRGKSQLGDYSGLLMEMDEHIGQIMNELRADAPNTIVILTADNGACSMCTATRERLPAVVRGVPIRQRMACTGHYVVAQSCSGWSTLRPDNVAHRSLGNTRCNGRSDTTTARLGDNDGKGIYFNGIDNSADILGKV